MPKIKIKRVPATTSNITTGIINYLINKGHYAFRVNNGAVYDPVKKVFRSQRKDAPGLSDIMGVLAPSGCFIAIEVKNARTGDRPKAKQNLFANQIKKRGGYHVFAKSYEGFIAWYRDNIYDNHTETELNLKSISDMDHSTRDL